MYISIPEKITRFFNIKLKSEFDLGFEKFEFPKVDNLNDFQIGYCVHGLTGNACEGWSNNWVVIARSNYDPLIYNSDNGSIMFARHGAGGWEPVPLFSDLEEMLRCFHAISQVVIEADEDLYDDVFNIKLEYVESIKEASQNCLGKEKSDLLIEVFEIKV
ncbi:MAG: hypothetical protein GY787_11300, partial [Alteromonadales bacterium]|nr:hypothetical protein [Alteromonadales bacterium]